MTIADPSLTRRIKQLEQQLATLERSLSQVRQSQAAFVAPRDRWLGRVATTPTPAATDDTYAVELISATFVAAPGQRDLVEHARGSTVVARTWPARALSAGDEVIVDRIRGGLAGDAERGEWWIGLDPGDAAQAAPNLLLLSEPRTVAYSGDTTYLRTNDDGYAYFTRRQSFGDPRALPASGVGAVYDDYAVELSDVGVYRLTLSLEFWCDLDGTEEEIADATDDFAHAITLRRPHWLYPLIAIKSDGGVPGIPPAGGLTFAGARAFIGALATAPHSPDYFPLAQVAVEYLYEVSTAPERLAIAVLPKSSSASGRCRLSGGSSANGQMGIEYLGTLDVRTEIP